MKPAPSSQEILPLTGLRAVAALYVFIFHIQFRWPLFPDSKFLTNLISQGAVGMSLFFVLSGFVLAKRYGDGSGNFRTYLTSRFARIYPIYVVVALLTLPWIGVPLDGKSSLEVARQVTKLFTLIASDIFVIQAWFPQLFAHWNNSGSWSISVEVFCYVLLPLLLMNMARKSNQSVKFIAVIAYTFAVLPGLVLVLFQEQQNLAFYSMPIYRLPEFVVGICTAMAVQRLKPSPRSTTALQLAGMAILIGYLGVVGNRLPMWIGHNWIVIPVIALTIFSTAQSFGIVSRVLSWKPIVWAGHISYSFYSFQLLVLLYLESHHKDIVRTFPALADNRMLLLASLAVLTTMAAVGYHFIEEPMRAYIMRKWKVRSAKVMATSAPVAVI